MKIFTSVVLLCFTVSNVSAADSLFFSYTTAQRLNAELHFQRSNRQDQTKIIDLKSKEIDLSVKESSLLKQKLEGLLLDTGALTKAKDEYKDLYQKENKLRIGCEGEKPSRMTWFGAGALTMAILGVVVLLAR